MENNKFSLFNGESGLQTKIYDSDRERDGADGFPSSKHQSGRPASAGAMRQQSKTRPSSANSTRGGQKPQSQRVAPSGDAVSVGGARRKEGNQVDNLFYYLEREDLLNTCLELKKHQQQTDTEIARLRYENQRLEGESIKQQRRIEKLISPQISKNGQGTLEIRKEIEKTVIVRQLKAQIHDLRELLAAKDKHIDTIQKSQKSTQVLELMAEKEEYFAEVQRLNLKLQSKDEDIYRLQSKGVSGYRGVNIEDELRAEISRLSAGYNELLSRLSQSENSRQLERLAQEQDFTPDQIDPHPPASRGSKRNIGGRSQSKKVSSSSGNQKAASKKRPQSASSTSSRKSKSNNRDSSPDDHALANDIKHSDVNLPYADQVSAVNDEWISMTFGSASFEPPPVASDSVGGNSDGVVMTTPHPIDESEASSRPMSSGRGRSNGRPVPNNEASLSLESAPNLNSRAITGKKLAFESGDKVRIIGGPYLAAISKGVDNSGVVTALNLLDMTCDIKFDTNGDTFRGVPVTSVQLISVQHQQSSSAPVTAQIEGFKPSDKVNAMHPNSGQWSAGIILKQHTDGSYDVMMDKGGDMLQRVPQNFLKARPVSSKGKAASKSSFSTDAVIMLPIGTRVDAHYRGSEKTYLATILKHDNDGTYVVQFDDGEVLSGVTRDSVKKKDISPDNENISQTANEGLVLGARIEANYRGRGRWYPGAISSINANGTFDVNFDDGELEKDVSSDRVRLNGSTLRQSIAADAPISSPVRDEIASFEPVLPNFPKRYSNGAVVESLKDGAWTSAIIRKENCDPIYSVKLTGAETKHNISASQLRVLKAFDVLQTGLPVYLIQDGRQHSGIIENVIVCYSYSVDYVQNNNVYDRSDKVISEHIRDVVRPKSNDTENIKMHYFSVGQTIEVFDASVNEWRLSAVQKLNTDGSYDITYSNGSTKSAVSPNNVRANIIQNSLSNESVSAGTDLQRIQSAGAVAVKTETVSAKEYPIIKGSKVEARYRGQSKWYPGTVIKDNGNGSYDVDYDDGERERGVKNEYIRIIRKFSRIFANNIFKLKSCTSLF